MTLEEYHRLDISKLYSFYLYYGDEFHGYLIKKEASFYFIYPHDLKVNNWTNARKTKLDHIERYEIFTPKQNENQSQSITFTNNVHAKKMVIIGAGASHDYCFLNNLEAPQKPPLTSDLFSNIFDHILDIYPGAKALSSDLIRVRNIEAYFQDAWENLSRSTRKDLESLSKLINTQYYLHHLMRKVSFDTYSHRYSNYSNLIRWLKNYIQGQPENERIIIVTFNYDSILEFALRTQLSYSFRSTNDYIDFDNRQMLLFKPHGSWNWVKRFEQTLFEGVQIPMNEFKKESTIAKYLYEKQLSLDFMQSHLNKNIYCIDPFDSENKSPYNLHFPWLLIPYRDKDSLMMPKSHEIILDHFLDEINELLIIGWKGSEEVFNRKLNSRLSSKNLNITALRGRTAQDNLSKHLPKANWNSLKHIGAPQSFTEFAHSLANKQYRFS